MTVVLARVDNRLIHGQVLEGWAPRLGISTIIVVDDEVADDPLRQAIMEIAVPQEIECKFFHINQLKPYLEDNSSSPQRILILFSEIQTAWETIQSGVVLGFLNIGNVHYAKGKKRITKSVSLTDKEISTLKEIDKVTPVDIRATPDDPMRPLGEFLKGGVPVAECEARESWIWRLSPVRWFRRRDISSGR